MDALIFTIAVARRWENGMDEQGRARGGSKVWSCQITTVVQGSETLRDVENSYDRYAFNTISIVLHVDNNLIVISEGRDNLDTFELYLKRAYVKTWTASGIIQDNVI